MKPFSQLTQAELLRNTETLVQEERRITLELIEHLREIRRRRLHEAMGFSSLHAFCVGHLGLSDGSAARRIAALDLTLDLPEAREKLESGDLSLSSAHQLQTFFRNRSRLGRPSTPEEKRTLVGQAEGLSRSQTERLLVGLDPAALPREQARVIAPRETELRLAANERVIELLAKLKGYWSHRLKLGTTAECLERLLEEAVEREERKRLGRAWPAGPLPASPSVAAKPAPDGAHSAAEWIPARFKRHRPAVPAALQRVVWTRALSRCEYVASDGRRCACTRYLEIDHVKPWMLLARKTHDAANLRLLCRAHNQYEARRVLGARIMDQLGRPTRAAA